MEYLTDMSNLQHLTLTKSENMICVKSLSQSFEPEVKIKYVKLYSHA